VPKLNPVVANGGLAAVSVAAGLAPKEKPVDPAVVVAEATGFATGVVPPKLKLPVVVLAPVVFVGFAPKLSPPVELDSAGLLAPPKEKVEVACALVVVVSEAVDVCPKENPDFLGSAGVELAPAAPKEKPPALAFEFEAPPPKEKPVEGLLLLVELLPKLKDIFYFLE